MIFTVYIHLYIFHLPSALAPLATLCDAKQRNDLPVVSGKIEVFVKDGAEIRELEPSQCVRENERTKFIHNNGVRSPCIPS